MSDICSSVTAEQTIRLGRLPEIFADDLIDMSAGGPTLTGAEARRHFVERVARTHERFHPHLLIHIDQIQVAGNWVYQHGSLVVTLVPKGGGETSFIRQRYLEIWRREPSGQWKITIEMDNAEENPNDSQAHVEKEQTSRNIEDDPLLALRGSGRDLWRDEHADEYVAGKFDVDVAA